MFEFSVSKYEVTEFLVVREATRTRQYGARRDAGRLGRRQRKLTAQYKILEQRNNFKKSFLVYGHRWG